MRTSLRLQGLVGKNRPMRIQARRTIQIALAVTVIVLTCNSARSDTVYVWSDDSTIKQFAANGVGSVLASNIFLSGMNGPVGLAVDNAGNLYAGSPGASLVMVYTTNGIGSEVGFADSVSGLAFDRAGNIYMTCPNYECLCIGYFTMNCTQSHLGWPTSLAFDKSGDIYVANGVAPYPFGNSPYTNTIVKFSPDLTYLGDFATNLDKPWGLAFDQAGNLFVSNSGDDIIYKFTPEGACTFFAIADGLSNPKGLAFDIAGNLYVANAGNGTIQKFTPEGFGTVFASGLNAPTSIAIQPGLKLWATLITLINPTVLPGGAFQFTFSNSPGVSFSALGTTNVSLPLSNWTVLGSVTEVWPGHFQFTDPQATNNQQRFYRVRVN